MKTVKDILEAKEPFKLAEEHSCKYNAILSNPEMIKKEGGEVLYSVYKIDERTNTAWANNKNAWGIVKSYMINTNDISPY